MHILYAPNEYLKFRIHRILLYCTSLINKCHMPRYILYRQMLQWMQVLEALCVGTVHRCIS